MAASPTDRLCDRHRASRSATDAHGSQMHVARAMMYRSNTVRRASLRRAGRWPPCRHARPPGHHPHRRRARRGVEIPGLAGSARFAATSAPAKREAVQQAIDELGYRPNAIARQLTERRTNMVGVLLNDLRNPWFIDCLDGLTSVLHEQGLRTLLADGRLDRRTDDALLQGFLELRVDGLVLVGVDGVVARPSSRPRRRCRRWSPPVGTSRCRGSTWSPTTTGSAPSWPSTT